MQFERHMEIDNPRKRCRGLDDHDEEEQHAPKKTRQSKSDAPSRDSASPSPSDSTVSTPASMVDESCDPFFSRPAPRPSGATIISGWNQARRGEDFMRRTFPWLFSAQ